MGVNLIEFDGNILPFSNDSFDVVVCFGVFDAVCQETILMELLRVVDLGGIILITGKNNLYFEDDDMAFIAEVNSRKNNHPNSFTNVKYMIEQLHDIGVEIIDNLFFLRRGDFPNNRFVTNMPDVFYEWEIVIRKTKELDNDQFRFKKFSDIYSETFKNKDN